MYRLLISILISFTLLVGLSHAFPVIQNQLFEESVAGGSVHIVTTESGSVILGLVSNSQYINNLHKDLVQQGLPNQIFPLMDMAKLIVIVDSDALPDILQLIADTASNHELSSFSVVISSNSNQQRLFGLVNRTFKNINITHANTDGEALSNISLISDKMDGEDYNLRLFANLLKCKSISNGLPIFTASSEKLICDQDEALMQFNDKDVVELKEKFYSNIQLLWNDQNKWLLYLMMFEGENRIELAQSYYQSLPSLSIDKILELYYQGQSIPVDEENLTQQEDSNIDGLRLIPNDLLSTVSLKKNNSGTIDYALLTEFELCTNIDCNELSELLKGSIDIAGNSLQVKIPHNQFTSVIDIIDNKVIKKFIGSHVVYQEQIQLFVEGNFIDEPLRKSLTQISQLPKQSLKLNVSAKNNANVIALYAQPGQLLWAQSELFYFHLLMLEPSLADKIKKSNSLVSLDLDLKVFPDNTATHLIIGDDNVDINAVLGAVVNDGGEQSFVNNKQKLITNIQLFNDSFALEMLSKLFHLPDYKSALIQQIESLTYAQYQYYLNNIIAAQIAI
ncbi:MAG: hypothetical protein HWD86_07685 [Kangiellaceae bacterium]|nr:hypothetical protein [Kangiellaceae bacterium]